MLCFVVPSSQWEPLVNLCSQLSSRARTNQFRFQVTQHPLDTPFCLIIFSPVSILASVVRLLRIIYRCVCSFSFLEMPDAVADFTFDDPDGGPREHRVYESMVKERLVDLFRRHGAIEWVSFPLLSFWRLLNCLLCVLGWFSWEPPPLLPVTELISFRKEPGARFLNRQGHQVELPYDGMPFSCWILWYLFLISVLTTCLHRSCLWVKTHAPIPVASHKFWQCVVHFSQAFARDVARTKLARLKRYHIGQSYRESKTGGQPLSFGEVAYDILSPVRSMASEAELIAVLDRILDTFPALSVQYEWEFQINHYSSTYLANICFILSVRSLQNHALVLSNVLAHVPSKRRLEVCDMLKDLGPKVSFAQLRSRLNLPRPVLDELERWYIDGEPFGSLCIALTLDFLIIGLWICHRTLLWNGSRKVEPTVPPEL